MRTPATGPRVRDHLLGALAAIMLAAGVATALFTVAAVYRLHVVLPVWDAWGSIADLQRVRAGTYGLADLARQYNEHRLLVPRLFFLVDDTLFGMSDRFNIAVMFLFQAANAAVLVGLMARLVARRATRLLLAGFMLLVLFSLRQEQNFTFGFQLQFTGVFTFAMLAALLYVDALCRLGTLGAAPRNGAWPRLALAWLLCAASTYTMANGVLAGFTLLVLALALGAPWRVSVATALVSTVLAAFYFHGYVRGTLGLSRAEALADPLAYPHFLAGLIGNVIGDDIDSTEALGAAGLAGLAAAAWRVVTKREREPACAALLAIMGFTVASACATTYGRIGIGIMQAYEGRYVEPTAIFWCALVVFWVPVATRAAPRPAALAGAGVLTLAVALLAGSMAVAEIRAPHGMVAQASRFGAFRDSLLAGLYDTEAARYEIFEQRDLESWTAFLRAGHLSLFGTPEAADLGRLVHDVGRLAPPAACDGTVAARADPATLGADGTRLRGVAWDVARSGPVRSILIAGPHDRVTGFGSLDKPASRSRTWGGTAKAAPGEAVSAYAVLSDGALCDLGTAAVAAR